MARFLLRRCACSSFLQNFRCSFWSEASERGIDSSVPVFPNKHSPTHPSPHHGVKLPELIPSGRDHVVDFSIELVDHSLWLISPGVAHAMVGIDAPPKPICPSVVEECCDFDVIDDLRVHKKLFYKLDKDSKEFEECNVDFHRTKSKRQKQEKLSRADLKKESKKSEKLRFNKTLTQAAQKNESKKLKKPEQKPLKQKNGSSPQERLGLRTPVSGVGIEKLLVEGKRTRTPTFNQLTDPYHLPFCLDIFITKGSVRACIVHRVTSRVVAVAHSISKDMKFDLNSRKDVKACAAVGGVLAQRAIEDDIHNVVYTPRKGDKIEGKLQIVLQSIIDNGIDVKVKLKQKRPVKARLGSRISIDALQQFCC